MWLNIQFFFSFLRSTGREYALKIIKKSKCRGKVSTKNIWHQRCFFQEMFCEGSCWYLCPSWQVLESLWLESLTYPLETLGDSGEKAVLFFSRCVCWFSSWLVVCDSLLFTPVVISSNFHNSRCCRKQKNNTNNYNNTDHCV